MTRPARKKTVLWLPSIHARVLVARRSWLPLGPPLVPIHQAPNTKNSTGVGLGWDTGVVGLIVESKIIADNRLRPFIKGVSRKPAVLLLPYTMGILDSITPNRPTRLPPLLPTLPPPHNLAVRKHRIARAGVTVGAGGQGDFSL